MSTTPNNQSPNQEIQQLRCQSPPLIKLGKMPERKNSALEAPSPKTEIDDTPRKLSDSVIPLKSYKSKFTLENLTTEMKKNQNLNSTPTLPTLGSPKTLYTKKPSITPLPISPIKIIDTATPCPDGPKESLPTSFQEYSYIRERKFSEKSETSNTNSDFSDEELVKTPKKISKGNVNFDKCSQNWKVQIKLIQEKKIQRPQQVIDEWRKIVEIKKLKITNI